MSDLIGSLTPGKKADLIVRQFAAEKPNQCSVGDITEYVIGESGGGARWLPAFQHYT
jgi:cytosine/adenosine deaminase-related metal-dependent hydrolase